MGTARKIYPAVKAMLALFEQLLTQQPRNQVKRETREPAKL